MQLKPLVVGESQIPTPNNPWLYPSAVSGRVYCFCDGAHVKDQENFRFDQSEPRMGFSWPIKRLENNECVISDLCPVAVWCLIGNQGQSCGWNFSELKHWPKTGEDGKERIYIEEVYFEVPIHLLTLRFSNIHLAPFSWSYLSQS